MHWKHWLCRIGDTMLAVSYFMLLGYVFSVAPGTMECNSVSDPKISDPAFWTQQDLIELVSFCSSEGPWPRPSIESNASAPRVVRHADPPALPKLHRSYRIANKAWANRANVQRRTKLVSEEVVLVDGFDTSASQVAAYADTNNGTLVIGYLSVGSYEDWRPDASKWPSACIGREYDGWDGENWLQIDKWELIKPVMLARLKMLRDKGFAGFEADNVGLLDQYTNKEKDTRKKVRPHAVKYAKWLADTAHGLGLLAVFKNAPYLVEDLVDAYDAIIIESPLKYNELDAYQAFAKKKKPVWVFEYSGDVDALVQKVKKYKIYVSDVLLETQKGWKRVI